MFCLPVILVLGMVFQNCSLRLHRLTQQHHHEFHREYTKQLLSSSSWFCLWLRLKFHTFLCEISVGFLAYVDGFALFPPKSDFLFCFSKPSANFGRNMSEYKFRQYFDIEYF